MAKEWHHLKPSEFQALLNAIEDLRWKALYLLAYCTGARFGELFNLTWSDIDLERSTMTISDRRASVKTPPFQVKDYENRTQLLTKQVIEALLAWQACHGAPETQPVV